MADYPTQTGYDVRVHKHDEPGVSTMWAETIDEALGLARPELESRDVDRVEIRRHDYQVRPESELPDDVRQALQESHEHPERLVRRGSFTRFVNT